MKKMRKNEEKWKNEEKKDKKDEQLFLRFTSKKNWVRGGW